MNNKYFDKEKQEKAQAWLKEKWTNRICDCCNANSWTMSDDLVMPIVFTGVGGINLNSLTYPQIMIVCNYCGNTKYFNAILSAVIPSKIMEE